jgi:hypothetical protein
LRALFYLDDAFNGVRIHCIRAQTVKTSGGKYNHPALFNNGRRLFYDFSLGLLGIYLSND